MLHWHFEDINTDSLFQPSDFFTGECYTALFSHLENEACGILILHLSYIIDSTGQTHVIHLIISKQTISKSVCTQNCLSLNHCHKLQYDGWLTRRFSSDNSIKFINSQPANEPNSWKAPHSLSRFRNLSCNSFYYSSVITFDFFFFLLNITNPISDKFAY